MSLTRIEAIQKLMDGKKIRAKSWESIDYIIMDIDGKIKDNNGMIIDNWNTPLNGSETTSWVWELYDESKKEQREVSNKSILSKLDSMDNTLKSIENIFIKFVEDQNIQ